MKRLLLVGGGHAHLFVLRRLARERRNDIAATLVSPSRWQYYSGMLPGWMAGTYQEAQCRVDLLALAEAAGVRFIVHPAVELRPSTGMVVTANQEHLSYDTLSLDIGSETNCRDLHRLGERLLPIRSPQFHDRWYRILDQARSTPGYQVAIVGGGAAGVEVALAAASALSKLPTSPKVSLICGRAGPLKSLGPRAHRLALRELARLGITVHRQRGLGTTGGLELEDGTTLSPDTVIATTGASAPRWMTDSGIAHDTEGYVRVDERYRSVSHPEIFAAGDICSAGTRQNQRSGVFAVRAGPALAQNLLAALSGRALTSHRPGRRALYILATGPQRAVATWGPFAGSGRWAWRLKDRIDRKFVASFAPFGVTR